jgi:hypothetical protein
LDDTVSSPPRRWARLADLSGVGLVLVLLVTAYPFVTYAYMAITFPYQIDGGEGPILDQVMRLSRFESIYRTPTATGPYTVANYPPFYHLVQLPFAWVAGPAFWYGRVVSWIAAVVTATCIGAVVFTLTRDRLAAITGSLVFASIPYAVMWAPAGRVDSLALALTWAALFTIVRRPEARWSVVAAAALFVASAFTRQTSMLAGPLAALAFLFGLGHRRQAALLATIAGASGALIALALVIATDGGFYFNIVTANVNPLALEPLTSAARDVLQYMPILLVCGAALFALEKSPAVRWLLLPYLLGAVVVALTIAKVGSNVNYLLELSAGLSACAGAIVAAVRARGPWLRTAVVAGLALQAVLLSLWWHNLWFRVWDGVYKSRPAIERIRTIVNRTDGLVLLDNNHGLLPLAGRSIYFQPFEMGQLAQSGHWDQSTFVRTIEEKQYVAIVIADRLESLRWTPEMRAAIARSYMLGDRVPGVNIYYRAPSRTPGPKGR